MKNRTNKEENITRNYLKGGDNNCDYLNSFSALEVKVVNNNFDRALKIFRAMVQKDRILSLYKQKQTYEKPSEKKRRKTDENRQRVFEAESKAKKALTESNNTNSKFKNRDSNE